MADTGIGIAPAKLGLVFEPFVPADTRLSRRFGGTGLGLAITQRLAALMDGEMAVTSAPGQGSEFSFTVWLDAGEAVPGVSGLPLRPPATGNPAGAPEHAPAGVEQRLRQLGQRGRLLLVEDNPVNQFVALALRQPGRNSALYPGLLQQFALHHGALLPSLLGLPAQGDAAVLRNMAHAVRGVAGTVGAVALAQQAQAIEAALARCAAVSAVASDWQALVHTVQPLVQQITALGLGGLPPATATVAGAVPAPPP